MDIRSAFLPLRNTVLTFEGSQFGGGSKEVSHLNDSPTYNQVEAVLMRIFNHSAHIPFNMIQIAYGPGSSGVMWHVDKTLGYNGPAIDLTFPFSGNPGADHVKFGNDEHLETNSKDRKPTDPVTTTLLSADGNDGHNRLSIIVNSGRRMTDACGNSIAIPQGHRGYFINMYMPDVATDSEVSEMVAFIAGLKNVQNADMRGGVYNFAKDRVRFAFSSMSYGRINVIKDMGGYEGIREGALEFNSNGFDVLRSGIYSTQCEQRYEEGIPTKMERDILINISASFTA